MTKPQTKHHKGFSYLLSSDLQSADWGVLWLGLMQLHWGILVITFQPEFIAQVIITAPELAVT